MLKSTPVNEAETIELFKLARPLLGWHIVHLQTRFPDAVIENPQGQRLVAEFEYLARNFKAHHHDPAGCDLVVCWSDNWPGAPLPVWALDNCLKPALATQWAVEKAKRAGRDARAELVKVEAELVSTKAELAEARAELANTKRRIAKIRLALVKGMDKAKLKTPPTSRNPLWVLNDEAFTAVVATVYARAAGRLDAQLDEFFT